MILTVTMNVAIDKRYVVEDFRIGSVMRVKECSYTAGGKGLNVSKVARISGGDVTATGIAAGHAGEYVTEELEKTGVKSDFVKVRGESRSCINIYDEKSGSQTEFLEPGVTVTAGDIKRFTDKYSGLLKKADIVSVSGSVPKGVESDFYNTLIELAGKDKKPILVDTSGELLKNAVLSKPDFIKPNTDEIEMLLGRKPESEKEIIYSAERLHNSGIKYVAVSLGKDGAVLVCEEGVYRGFTPDIPVINTVGCGDSMVAEFAVGISRREPAEEIFRKAIAVSTANALRVETGFYLKEDMEKILPQVRITKIR